MYLKILKDQAQCLVTCHNETIFATENYFRNLFLQIQLNYKKNHFYNTLFVFSKLNLINYTKINKTLRI